MMLRTLAEHVEVWTLHPERLAGLPLSVLSVDLDEDEQEQARRFLNEDDRLAYVTAHALLRALLSRHVPATRAKDWRFDRPQRHGKPSIIGSDISFSLSHCKGLVAVALAKGQALGIDAEMWRAPAPREIAARFFSGSERAMLASCPEAERDKMFYRIWTAKEAVAKATGQGLSLHFPGFTVSLDPPTVTTRPQHSSPQDTWHLVLRDIGARHVVALASPSMLPEIIFRDGEDLLRPT